VQAEIRQIRVAIGVARSDGTAGETRSTKAVGVIAAVGAVEVIIVSSLEGVRPDAGIHGCFVYAAECLVCCDALADVEGIER